ncbi:MAG: hypothetical protein WAT19_08925 [Ferruginibacter sp.]
MNENTDILIEEFIKKEKSTRCNPFLHTRVMAAIEKNKADVILVKPVWRNALAVISLIASIWAGIAAGEFYNLPPEKEEIVFINDRYPEHFDFINDESNN